MLVVSEACERNNLPLGLHVPGVLESLLHNAGHRLAFPA